MLIAFIAINPISISMWSSDMECFKLWAYMIWLVMVMGQLLKYQLRWYQLISKMIQDTAVLQECCWLQYSQGVQKINHSSVILDSGRYILHMKLQPTSKSSQVYGCHPQECLWRLWDFKKGRVWLLISHWDLLRFNLTHTHIFISSYKH